MTRSMLLLCLPLMAASVASADDRVLLQEVMPELAGTPLGALDIAPAPPLGATLVVRRAEVQRALLKAGLSGKDLSIPHSMRVTRAIDVVSSQTLVEQARGALSEAAAPCELRDARVPAEVRLAAGPREFRAEFPSGLRNGSVTGSLFVETGSQNARVPVVVHLSCPPPEVSAGMQVTARAIIGSVVASAPAEARQPGRIGEVIRITNRITGAVLRARVVDSHTVEVVP